MKTEIFNFYVPPELIAQNPLKSRSDSRLLVYYRAEDRIIDSSVKRLADFLNSDHFLVFNNSKVIPARIFIKKKENNKSGEFLILKIIDEYKIEVVTDRVKKYPDGSEIVLPDGSTSKVEQAIDQGIKIISCEDPVFTYDYFEKYGHVPLPPYIKKSDSPLDKERYQTIYSRYYGSSAAPTAGLHFDAEIFNSLDKNKIKYAFISLHVGLGTFQPIYADNIEEHKIHKEEFFIDEAEAEKINNAFKTNKKIIPVGTTSLRTLESLYDNGTIKSGSGNTDLYIYPSYKFKAVRGLFTNFHTPKSSLAVLAASLIGVEKLLEIYKYAVGKEYRFFSYGDAMLIL
jgi:S-adenosylmethionine:tRNA ribosyltransferase-isomerase